MSPLSYVRAINAIDVFSRYIAYGAVVVSLLYPGTSVKVICYLVLSAAYGLVLALRDWKNCEVLLSYEITEPYLKGSCVRQGAWRSGPSTEIYISRSSVSVVQEVRPLLWGRLSLTCLWYKDDRLLVADAKLKALVEGEWDNVKCQAVTFFRHWSLIAVMTAILGSLAYAFFYINVIMAIQGRV